MTDTTISVSDEVADILHDMKNRGDSYDDVLVRLLIECGEISDDPRND